MVKEVVSSHLAEEAEQELAVLRRHVQQLQQENAQLAAVLGESQDFEATLYTLFSSLAAQRDLSDIYQLVCSETAELLRMDGACLWLPDEQGKYLLTQAACGYGQEQYWGLRIPLETSSALSARVARTRQGEYVAPTGDDPSYYPVLPGGSAVTWPIKPRSLLALPILGTNKLLGVLTFIDMTNPGRFNDQLLHRGEILVRHMAAVIEQARLQQETLRRTRQLAALQKIARAVGASLEVETIFQAVAEQVPLIVSNDRTVLVLYFAETQELYISRLAVEISSSWIERTLFEQSTDDFGIHLTLPASGVLHQVITTQQSILLTQERRPTQREPEATADELVFGTEFQSLCAVPIVFEGLCVGLVFVESQKPETFTTEHQAVLEELSSHLALAIKNAILYKESQRRQQEAETLQQISRDIASRTDVRPVLGSVIEHTRSLLKAEQIELALLSWPEDRSKGSTPPQQPEPESRSEQAGNPSSPFRIPARQPPSPTRQVSVVPVGQNSSLDPAKQQIWLTMLQEYIIRWRLPISLESRAGQALATGQLVVAGSRPVNPSRTSQPRRRRDRNVRLPVYNYTLDDFPARMVTGLSTLLAVPLLPGGNLFGALILSYRSPYVFQSIELQVAATLADQAAIAMEHAYALQEAARANALQEADRLKSELLSTVSHELRTPLGAIKGFTTLLQNFEDELSRQEKRKFLRIIDTASDRLTELIDNLLQMSRLEAGALPMEISPVDLGPLLKEISQGIPPIKHTPSLRQARRYQAGEAFLSTEPSSQAGTQAHKRKPRVRVELTKNLPKVQADPRRIRQVMHNLLENAFKYSPNGGVVTIRARVVPHGASMEEQEVLVQVQDEGVGIPSEHLERIFERFHRVDSSLTRETGGSGLGLAICRGIIEAHGGRIWAESILNKGSTFSFSLPVVFVKANPTRSTKEVAVTFVAPLAPRATTKTASNRPKSAAKAGENWTSCDKEPANEE